MSIDEKQQTVRDEMYMRAYLEDFFKRWAPEDPEQRQQFYADFGILTGRIYVAAQTPFLKMLEFSMARQPIWPQHIHGDPSSQ